MKKTALLLIAFIMLISASACGAEPSVSPTQSTGDVTEASSTPSATPTPPPDLPDIPDLPEYPNETVDVTELDEFTIIYPDAYADWQMEEVYLLQDVIERIAGKQIDAVSDKNADASVGRKIIFASSDIETPYSEYIAALASRMDYIIAVNDGNIILGGQNYYSDMRAAYDLINNYLGYDDIENSYSEPKNISGAFVYVYEEPEFTIMGSNFACDPMIDKAAVKDIAEAHFNLFHIDTPVFSAIQIRDFAKLCARFEIRVLSYVQLTKTNDFWINGIDSYKDNPIIYGHYIRDEPKIEDYNFYSDLCDKYTEQFSQYGWKPFMNFFGFENYWPYLIEHEGLYQTVPTVSFDRYFDHCILEEGASVLRVYEMAKDCADRNNQDLWTYISSAMVKYKNQNTSKMFRYMSYTSLCFGAKGISYFQYGDASKKLLALGDKTDEFAEGYVDGSLINVDFERNASWYDAKDLHEELLAIYSILKNYKNTGAYTISSYTLPEGGYLQNPYPYFTDVITDFEGEGAYLVGCYDKQDGDGNAFILMNMETLDNVPCDETVPTQNVKIKINGDNVNFYLCGELVEIEKDADGRYNVPMANGYCWFVTVD